MSLSSPEARSYAGLAAACLLAVLIAFAGIGSHSLWSPDEPTGAAVGRAMLESGDLIVPRLNGEPFLEKPPLYWWVQVAALRAFGILDSVARLPSALFSMLTLLVAYAIGRRLGGPRQGMLALVVLGTTVVFVQNLGRVVVDPALTFFVALAHLGFAVLAEPRSVSEARWARLLVAVAIPLGFLSKGVVAIGLGAGPPVLYLLATRRGRALRELALLAALGVPVFALLVTP
ncbi:MAG TPA: glycosyltransferase family 39 protein, partial [Thermoanaerobaculia bacterium]|nr:glycosyltransferase family 39 protein [Thermoanaerobaculia bacterium]